MKTLERFLKYWRKGNYRKMYKLCQKTWQHNHGVAELKNLFDGLRLDSYKNLHESGSASCLKKVELELKINGVNKYHRANVICEKKAFKPSTEGEWGVNPISILNGKEIKPE